MATMKDMKAMKAMETIATATALKKSDGTAASEETVPATPMTISDRLKTYTCTDGECVFDSWVASSPEEASGSDKLLENRIAVAAEKLGVAVSAKKLLDDAITVLD